MAIDPGIGGVFWVGDFDGLLFEPVAEFVINFRGDFGTSFSEVGIGSSGFIDKDEGSFRVDAKAVDEEVFEAGLFDEPSGAEFVAVFGAMDRVAFVLGEFGFGVGEVEIFKEGAGARLF